MQNKKFKPPNGYYVYEWFRIKDNHVFYVGKGKNDRAIQLRPSKRNQFFRRYIAKYKSDYRIVQDSLEEHEAYVLENELVQKYKKLGQCECNLADTSNCSGGGTLYGELNGMFGKTHSDKVKKILHDINSDGRHAGSNNSQYKVTPKERMDPQTYKQWQVKQAQRKVGDTNPNAHGVLMINTETLEYITFQSTVSCAKYLQENNKVISERYNTIEKIRYIIKHSNKTKAIYDNLMFVIYSKKHPIDIDNTVSSLKGRHIRKIPVYERPLKKM